MGSVNLITLARPTPDEEPLQTELNKALVRELILTAKGGASGLLGASLLAWLLVRPWTGSVVSALFVALAGLCVTRLAVSIWLERGAAARLPHMRVFCWLAVVYGLTGACIAAIVIASCPQLPLVRTLMLLVVTIGINSTAMVTLAASPLIYVLYVSPILSGWILLSFAHPLPGLERVFQMALAVYCIVMVVTTRSVHRSLRNNVVLRLRLAGSLGELRDTQSKLVEASRQAGRSDVATAVLHNVGNVLNSVNVSATQVNDIVTKLKTGGLSKIVTLIAEHRDDLGRFFRDDHRGQKLPDYFAQLQIVLERDKTAAAAELQSLMRNIDHIKVIVASQQAHVTQGGAIETFDVRELLDDALKFTAASCAPGAIEIVRNFDGLPPATLDRHKALQILMNLLANARDAVMTKTSGDRRITVSARSGANGNLEITIEDNGCGVDAQNLEQMFGLGFTTKGAGHGLGLHYSACAARELHGSLTARSAGIGSGASFVLVVPLDTAQRPGTGRLPAALVIAATPVVT